MREYAGDLWTWGDGEDDRDDYDVLARVVTTNGFVTPNGRAVMGAGVALQAVERWGPRVEEALGERLVQYGNHVHSFRPAGSSRPYWLVTFPVKPEFGPNGEPGFKVKADIDLIKRSAHELVRWVVGIDEAGYTGTVVMPRPGCGNGGLSWFSEVKPLLQAVLDQPVSYQGIPETFSLGDRFVVVHP